MRSIDTWWTMIFAGFLIVWVIVIRNWQTLSGTTLVVTRGWLVTVLTVWTVAWLFESLNAAASPAIGDHLWYAASVFSLCPPISVLGARRPGTKAWPWFVMMPMILVLGWPVFALLVQGGEWHGIHLETPQLIAFLLVLVMGVGNYCGTRYTLAAIFYGIGVAASVLCVSTVAPAVFADRSLVRNWCLVALFLAVVTARMSAPLPANTGLDRLWVDFFDTFGIVWGRRIQDRINFIAQKEGLAARLELTGFDWSPVSAENPASSTAEENSSEMSNGRGGVTATEFPSQARIEHLMRWLLRRFVDPSWIDERLGSRSGEDVTAFVVDS